MNITLNLTLKETHKILKKKPLNGGIPPKENIIISREDPKTVFNLNKEDISVIKSNLDVNPTKIFFKKPIKDQTEKLVKIYIKKHRHPLKSPSNVPEEIPKKIRPELTIPLYARRRFNFV
jgi:hypothetical protein